MDYLKNIKTYILTKILTKEQLITFAIAFGLSFIIWSIQGFKSKDSFGSCIDYYYTVSAHIENAAIVRKYNKSRVPSCAWDVRKDIVYVCDQRDTLYNCVRGHWEDEFDYSIVKWKSHSIQDTTVYRDQTIYPIHIKLPNKNYRIKNKSINYFVTVKYKDQTKKFKVQRKDFIEYGFTGRIVPIKVRKRSDKFYKLKHG